MRGCTLSEPGIILRKALPVHIGTAPSSCRIDRVRTSGRLGCRIPSSCRTLRSVSFALPCQQPNPVSPSQNYGGLGGIRTRNPLHAMQVRYRYATSPQRIDCPPSLKNIWKELGYPALWYMESHAHRKALRAYRLVSGLPTVMRLGLCRLCSLP